MRSRYKHTSFHISHINLYDVNHERSQSSPGGMCAQGVSSLNLHQLHLTLIRPLPNPRVQERVSSDLTASWAEISLALRERTGPAGCEQEACGSEYTRLQSLVPEATGHPIAGETTSSSLSVPLDGPLISHHHNPTGHKKAGWEFDGESPISGEGPENHWEVPVLFLGSVTLWSLVEGGAPHFWGCPLCANSVILW